MPHDRKGDVLKVGDRVVVFGTVKEIWEGEEACNVRVEADSVEDEHPPDLTCNSKFFQLERTAINRAAAGVGADGEEG